MSSLIENWKKSGNYSEGVELLQLYAPDHSMLPILKKGKSKINELYLRQAINSLKIEPPRQRAKTFREKHGGPEYLHNRLRELYKLKNQRRNQFFDVETNAERAAISDDLIEYRKQIHDLCRQIEYYEVKGELVEIPDLAQSASEDDLPDDLYTLSKNLNNIRSNLTKAKRYLKAAYAAKDKNKIEKYSQKVTELEQKKEALERKINTLRDSENKEG